MNILRTWGLSLACYLIRPFLSLRYHIRIKGLSEIKQKRAAGALFLPSHPAEIDPVILMILLWPKYQLRPVVVEHFYYQKGLRLFMKLVRAFPLPTMDVPNQWKARRIEKLKKKMLEEMHRGKNFLLYPSGRLKRSGEEKLGAASMLSELLEMEKDLPLVLIRTTGLWGSTFSRAITGTSPDFGKTLLNGIKVLLKNGLFFTPRRLVEIEVALSPNAIERNGEKMELNRSLEQWYNERGKEEIKLVSFVFWKEDLPQVTAEKLVASYEEVNVSEEVSAQVIGYFAKLTRRPFSDLLPHIHLANDLGLDSLDLSGVYLFLEERFDVTNLPPGQLQTIHDVLQAAAGAKGEGEERSKPKSKWPSEPLRKEILIPEGETIYEVFLNSCQRLKEYTACGDGLTGTWSYQKLKRSILVLASHIQKFEGERVGVLLPSSVGAYMVILAVLCAGKVPVMLNWTTGFRNLEHAAKTAQLKHVISSFRFLSRLDGVDLGTVDDLLILLEEMKDQISFVTKFKGLFLSYQSPKKIIQLLGLKKKGEDEAVLIFTSGTETLPKGVPLSHKNILSNQRAALSCITLRNEDTFYGVLPPFHSFGFSMTGTFPLLSGIKVFYAPDPTDAKGLANDIEHVKPTLFCCAPSFVAALVRSAKDEQLKSLRVVVLGAEKAPQELYDTLEAKGKVVLEGYGISECSPVVTIERESDKHIGVGKPIPGVELCIIDPDSGQVLNKGDDGEVCIFGPNLFSGYLGIDKDPFIEIKNKRWYRSGDRGRIDPSGTLILTGRLGRFIKVGGEMVSLGGLEQDVLKIEKNKGQVAVTSYGRESDKPSLVLFTTFPIDREEINSSLRQMGQSRLVKFSQVRQIDEIPLTGTGKVHYRMLEEMV